MTREETIDKILNELLDDFIKAKLPLMKGMTLFAKVQNAVNYVANLSAEPCEDVFQYAEKVVTKAVEETDKFIFETIKPYCEAIEEREISKRDLECALTQYFHKEPCEDAISRQAVLDLVVANHRELNGLNVVMYSPLYKDITQLPSVQPIRPKGKWMKAYYWSEGFGMGESYGYYYECSQCGKSVKGGFSECGQNFCPNCGAKMEGEETV